MRIAVANRGFVVPGKLRGTESFLLYDMVNGKAVNEQEEPFSSTSMSALLAFLKRQNVQTLICGVVDFADRQQLEAGGIQIIYGITNGVVVAVSRFEDGSLASVEDVKPIPSEPSPRDYCVGNCGRCPNPCH